MKYKSILLVLTSFWFVTFDVSAQENKKTIVKDVFELEWEILADGFKGSGPVMNHLTIRNVSGQTLKKNEWTIFYSGSGVQNILDSEEEFVKVEWINGDYHKLSPGKDWKDLAPGTEITIPLRINNLLNVRNIPKGLYLVSDHYKNGLNLNMNVLPSLSLDTLEMIHASEIYEKNQTFNKNKQQKDLPLILPTPVSYTRNLGEFKLNAKVLIKSHPRFNTIVEKFQQDLNGFLTQAPQIQESKKQSSVTNPTIQFIFQEDIAEEGYHLSVENQGIKLIASTDAGMFYAIQSFKALLPIEAWKQKHNELKIPCVEVEDFPRFPHRAFMLDVARNFQEKEEIFKVLDLLSFYKINTLHFHLTDDEGWRLEISDLPELTEVGGTRGHTSDERDHLRPAYGSGANPTGNFGSGYYTRSDFIEILRYAKNRHIRVIPEIETPGHARAAIKAMEARYHRLAKAGDEIAAWQFRLADPEDRSVYKSAQAFTDNIMNVAMPSVYNFLYIVFDELISIYKEADVELQTIHIGGDEVPNGVWEKSPIAKDLLKNTSSKDLGGLSNEKVDGLWFYYLEKVANLLSSKGLYLSGWEEVGMKKTEINNKKTMEVDPLLANHNFHVDVWNNVGHQIDLPYRLANAGYSVILSNVTNYYLDLAYNTSYYENGHQWGGHVDLDKTFRFAPFDYYKTLVDNRSGVALSARNFIDKERLSDQGTKKILGIQAPLWSEFILGPERLEFMLLPKLLGLVERSWSAEKSWETLHDSTLFEYDFQTDWVQFLQQLGQRELPRLDFAFGGFQYRIPTPGLKQKDQKWYANTQISDFTIFYTKDGQEPTLKSLQYHEPIEIKSGENYVFRVFNKNGRGGRAIRVFNSY